MVLSSATCSAVPTVPVSGPSTPVYRMVTSDDGSVRVARGNISAHRLNSCAHFAVNLKFAAKTLTGKRAG